MKKYQYTYAIVISFMVVVLSLFGCVKPKKKVIECTDPYAINYNQSGEEEYCNYPRNMVLSKTYNMRLESYPLQPSQEGDECRMDVRNYYCPTIELYHGVTLYFVMSSFAQSEMCIEVNKDLSFSSPNDSTLEWAGAYYVLDDARFYGANYDSVVMNGRVYNSGNFYPMVLRGGK